MVAAACPIASWSVRVRCDHRGRIIRKHAGHRRQIADVSVDDPEQRDDGGLIGGDRVEVADVDGPPLVRMVADV